MSNSRQTCREEHYFGVLFRSRTEVQTKAKYVSPHLDSVVSLLVQYSTKRFISDLILKLNAPSDLIVILKFNAPSELILKLIAPSNLILKLNALSDLILKLIAPSDPILKLNALSDLINYKNCMPQVT